MTDQVESKRALLAYVREELAMLAEDCSVDPALPRVRKSAGTLRELINNQRLAQAWSASGLSPKQPRIVAPMLVGTKVGDSEVAFAGGGRRAGHSVMGVSIRYRAVSEREIRDQLMESVREASFELKAFSDSTALFVRGLAISRRQVIGYVANKLGGIHFDTSRRSDEDAYTTLDHLPPFAVGGNEEGVEPLPPVYYELMSIAQAVTQSPDIRRLVDQP